MKALWEWSNAPEYSRYERLGKVSKDEPTPFEFVVDMTATQIGDMATRAYRRSAPCYELDFDPCTQDNKLVRSETDAEPVASIIDDIYVVFIASWQ